jgi:hypothetical protein
VTQGELFLRWLVAFALTQAVECPIYVRAFRVRLPVAFAASALTHPVVCFVLPALWRAVYLATVTAHPSWKLSPGAYFVGYGALAEPLAVIAEAAWLAWRARLPWRRAFLASIVANTASALVGLLCSWLTGWP